MQYHVLIIEDDESLRQLYGLYLSRNNYTYTAFGTAQEALRLMPTLDIDLILVDVNLENTIDGLEFVKIVRDNRQYDNIKIITITSFPERFEVSQLLGIDLYLIKPVDYERLITTINHIFAD